MRAALTAIAVACAITAAGAGQNQSNAWRWTDDTGAVHITNKRSIIPEAFRGRAKKMKLTRIENGSRMAPVRRGEASGAAVASFETNHAGVIVPAVFNDTVTRHVLIDTGSEWVMITSKLARALGYDTGKSERRRFRAQGGALLAPVVDLAGLAIGGASMAGLKAAVIDFEGRGPVSAVVGMNFLSGFVFEIDTSRGRLSLWAGDADGVKE